MPIRPRHIVTIVALAFAGLATAGCGSMNEKIGGTIGDVLPQWAGGLPRDAPPRKGTPEYDAYMRERERARLEPASTNANAAAPGSASAPALDPVH